ncbi:MAG: type II secretion system protein GspN [Kofleriaceae bacterium]
MRGFSFHLPGGPRTRKAIRIAGYILLALVSFVVALQLTFPYERVKSRIEDTLASKYDVKIGSVERGLIPGRMYLKSITLRTRPATSDVERVMRLEEKSERDRQMALLVTTFFIQELQIDVGLFAALTGKASIDFDATIGSGSIAGNITIGKSATEVAIEGEGLPSELLPMREAIGLPLSGKVRFAFNLDLPNEKLKTGKVGPNWLKAAGNAMFQCPSGCTIGDGKTKLKAKLKKASQQEFVGEGIDFGKVMIQSLLAKVEVKKGKLAITKFEAKSDDGKLEVEYEMALQQNVDDSEVEGCLRFEGSETLRKREAKTHTALTTTGAQRGPDGLFHIRLDGKFKDMKRLPQSCGPGVPKDAATAGGSTSGGSSTPSLKVQPPDEPIRPPGEGAAIPSTQLVTPDAGAADAAVNVPVPGPGSENHTGSGSAGSSGSAAPGSGSAFGSAAFLPDVPAGSAAPSLEPPR